MNSIKIQATSSGYGHAVRLSVKSMRKTITHFFTLLTLCRSFNAQLLADKSLYFESKLPNHKAMA